jgi:hypothetical protein
MCIFSAIRGRVQYDCCEEAAEMRRMSWLSSAITLRLYCNPFVPISRPVGQEMLQKDI